MTKDDAIKAIEAKRVPEDQHVTIDRAMAGSYNRGLDHAIEAIRALPDAGWRDISEFDWQNAKDGCEMLIYNDRGQFVGSWEPDWSMQHGYHGGWWMISDGKDFERPLRGDTPTHWMPLPHPPEKA